MDSQLRNISCALLAATASVGIMSYILSRHAKTKPETGPSLMASMKDGFCGHNELLISRLPFMPPGNCSWKILLHLLHEINASYAVDEENLGLGQEIWKNVPTTELERRDNLSGVSISRITLITLLTLSNGRVIYEYSDSSGYRAAFGSWIGQWYLNYRVGHPAVVTYGHTTRIHSPQTSTLQPSMQESIDVCRPWQAWWCTH